MPGFHFRKKLGGTGTKNAGGERRDMASLLILLGKGSKDQKGDTDHRKEWKDSWHVEWILHDLMEEKCEK